MTAKLRVWLACIVVFVLMVAGLVGLALQARETGSPMVVNSLGLNSRAIGTAVRLQIERAFAVGISLEDMVGVDAVLAAELQRHKELSFFALVGKNAGAGESGERGKVIAFVTRPQVQASQRQEMQKLVVESGDGDLVSESYRAIRMDISERRSVSEGATVVPTPPVDDQQKRGVDAAKPGKLEAAEASLVIGYPINYIDQQLNAVATDLIVAVLIALVLVAEFLRYSSQRSAVGEFVRFIDYTSQVKSGNLGVRAHVDTNPANPMGALSSTLDQRLNTIKQGYDTLMERVERAPSHLQASVKAELEALASKYHLLGDPVRVTSTGEVAKLRMGVFLIAMAEEICRPFFAVFASGLDGPISLSPQLLAGIPLTVFLMIWAFAQPVGATLLTRFGPNRCLTVSASIVSLGMIVTALTSSWTVLVVVRALTGGAYGGMFIFTLAMMLRHAGPNGSAGAMAGFLSAVVAAGMCGPVIGGLVAGNFGFTAAFLLAAVCAISSVGFVIGTSDVAEKKNKDKKQVSIRATLRSLENKPFLVLMVFSTIPAKLVTTAVLFMLVPLTVLEMGESPAVAGRLILLYFFGVFLVSGYIGSMSDRLHSRKAFVTAGGMISAVACFIGYQMDSLLGLVVLCSLLGLGQAALANSQALLATRMMVIKEANADRELALGIYRLIDRFGGALGPVMAAVLIKQFSLSGAMLGVGIIVGVGSIVAALALWNYKDSSDEEEIPREVQAA